jgi:hypothetical protein
MRRKRGREEKEKKERCKKKFFERIHNFVLSLSGV